MRVRVRKIDIFFSMLRLAKIVLVVEGFDNENDKEIKYKKWIRVWKNGGWIGL